MRLPARPAPQPLVQDRERRRGVAPVKVGEAPAVEHVLAEQARAVGVERAACELGAHLLGGNAPDADRRTAAHRQHRGEQADADADLDPPARGPGSQARAPIRERPVAVHRSVSTNATAACRWPWPSGASLPDRGMAGKKGRNIRGFRCRSCKAVAGHARSGAVLVALAPLLAVACAQPPPPQAEAVRPVKTTVIAAGSEMRERLLSGTVEASRRVELAFQVSGVLAQLPVREGQSVAKGEMIAQLRQDEFEAQLKARQSQLDQARAALGGGAGRRTPRAAAAARGAGARGGSAPRQRPHRVQPLLRGCCSPAPSRGRSSTRCARPTWSPRRSTSRPASCSRRAPRPRGGHRRPGGRGARARGAGWSRPTSSSRTRPCSPPTTASSPSASSSRTRTSRAKQPIVTLPGRRRDRHRRRRARDADGRRHPVGRHRADGRPSSAGAPGVQFPVHIREVAQQADPTTQTYRDARRDEGPAGRHRAARHDGHGDRSPTAAPASSANQILVPISAVFKDAPGEQVAWVIGKDEVVQRRPVKVGAATGSRSRSSTGCSRATASPWPGVRFLRDGHEGPRSRRRARRRGSRERRRVLGPQQPHRLRRRGLRLPRRRRGLREPRPARGPRVHDQGSADHHAVPGRQRRRGRAGGHQPDRERRASSSASSSGSNRSRRAGARWSAPSSRTGSTPTPIPQVWDELRRKINDVQPRLPPSVRGRSMVIDDFGDVYGVFLAITGDGFTQAELRRYAEFLRRELQTVQDVKKVDLFAEQQEVVFLEMSRQRLAQLGINEEQIYGQLQARTSPPTAAGCASATSTSRIDPQGGFDSADDMLDLVIGVGGTGRQLLLARRGDAGARRPGPAAPPAALRRQAGHRPRHLHGARRQRRDDGRGRAAQARRAAARCSRSASRSARSTSSPRRSPRPPATSSSTSIKAVTIVFVRAADRDGPRDRAHRSAWCCSSRSWPRSSSCT